SRWQLAALIYAGVLLPYVLISYYTRYAAPLLAIKCLLVLFLVDFVLGKYVLAASEPSISDSNLTVRDSV
ncbi:MAG: hypothetical protein WBD31_27285, partial [Rubripirellula sp.]